MKKAIASFFTILFFTFPALLDAQVIVGDCRVVYRVLAEGSNAANELFRNASKTFYVRGNKTLTETVFGTYTQKIYYNATDSSTVITKESGGNKFLSRLPKENWVSENDKYKHAILIPSTVTKKILGYECVKATIQMSDKEQMTVFYTKDIKPNVSEHPHLFNKIPGLVLEYQTQLDNKLSISYIASSVSLFPIPASLFDIPKSGFRVLN